MRILKNATPPTEAHALLANLVGQKLISLQRIERYSFEKLGPELGIVDTKKYFRMASGDVFIRFESGICLRVSSDSRRKTVLVAAFDGSLETVANTPDYLDKTGVIWSADGQHYSDERMRALNGTTLTNIGILTAIFDDPRCVNQRGIVFYMSGQAPIILGIQLGGRVSSLSFLEFEELLPELRPSLQLVGIQGESLPF